MEYILYDGYSRLSKATFHPIQFAKMESAGLQLEVKSVQVGNNQFQARYFYEGEGVTFGNDLSKVVINFGDFFVRK